MDPAPVIDRSSHLKSNHTLIRYLQMSHSFVQFTLSSFKNQPHAKVVSPRTRFVPSTFDMGISSEASHLLDFSLKLFLAGLLIFSYFVTILSNALIVDALSRRYIVGFEDESWNPVTIGIVSGISIVCAACEFVRYFLNESDIAHAPTHALFLVVVLIETDLICGMFFGTYSVLAFAWRTLTAKSLAQGSKGRTVLKEL